MAQPWRLHPYDIPLATPYRWAQGEQRRRHGAWVELDGGWGEIAPPPHEPFDAAACTRDVARCFDGPWEDASFLHRMTVHSVPARVRCGVSSAWWDRMARAQERPLAEFLAATHGMSVRPSVAVNGLVTGDGDDARAQVEAALAMGIRTLKIKCGADRATDIARVQAVRDAAPDAVLRLDANQAWHAEWAMEHMEALAPFGIDYVEQPLPAGDPGMRRLQAAEAFDVAIDEAATDARSIHDAITAGEAKVAILKPQRLGGPSGTLEAMQTALDAGGRAVVTNSLETAVGVHVALHVAALSPRDEACGLATGRFLANDVGPTPAIQAGRMALPEAPGLGFVPDLEASP